MTAPVAIPGGAPLEQAGAGRGSGRRDEAGQPDGVFAALLAALAPPVTAPNPGAPPVAEAAPAAPETAAGVQPWLIPSPARAPGAVAPQAPLSGQGLPEEVPAEGSFPFAVPADLAAAGLEGEPAPAGAAVAGPGMPPAPAGEPFEAEQHVRLGTEVQPAQAPEPVQAEVNPAEAPEAASLPEDPTAPQAAGPKTGPAGGVEADAQAEGDAGEALQPGVPAGEAVAEHGGAQTEPVAGPLPEAQAAPAPEAQGSTGDEAPAGLERLTARSLQVQQVVEELTRAVPEMEDGQYRLTLRLYPEHLGEVRLQLHLSGREVYATMEVTTADARQLLESRGDQLRESLADAGYALSGFEVATGEGRQPRQGPGEEPAGWSPPPVRRAAPTEVAAATAIGRVRPAGTRGGRLDMKA